MLDFAKSAIVINDRHTFLIDRGAFGLNLQKVTGARSIVRNDRTPRPSLDLREQWFTGRELFPLYCQETINSRSRKALRQILVSLVKKMNNN